jgi:hypothetical protein
MNSEAWKSLGVLPRRWRWTFHVWNLETSLTSVVSGCGSMTHIFAQLRETTVFFFQGVFLFETNLILGFMSGRVLLLNPSKELLYRRAWLSTLPHLHI